MQTPRACAHRGHKAHRGSRENLESGDFPERTDVKDKMAWMPSLTLHSTAPSVLALLQVPLALQVKEEEPDPQETQEDPV